MSLWTELSTLIANAQFNSTFLEIPRPVRVDILSPKQAAILVEEVDLNKKKIARVRLHNVVGTAFDTLTASLNITISKKEYSLPAYSIHLDSTTRILTLDFPSLADMNLSKPDKITVNVLQTAWKKGCEERKAGMSPLCDQLTNKDIDSMTFMVLASKPLSISQGKTPSVK